MNLKPPTDESSSWQKMIWEALLKKTVNGGHALDKRPSFRDSIRKAYPGVLLRPRLNRSDYPWTQKKVDA